MQNSVTRAGVCECVSHCVCVCVTLCVSVRVCICEYLCAGDFGQTVHAVEKL